MFARAVLVPHTPLLIPPYPMMRTRCWSLFLELMTKLPVWPWESPILTITNCLFSAFQLSSSKIYKPKHQPGLWIFYNCSRHKSSLFWTITKFCVLPFLWLGYSNSAMLFHHQPHNNSPKENKKEANTALQKGGAGICSIILQFNHFIL